MNTLMKAVLSRYYTETETLGILVVTDKQNLIFECRTIELPWKENQHNISCIPEGSYIVEKYNSPSKGQCFHIINVTERDSILIHKGNYTTDTKGCIIVGKNFQDINGDGHLDVYGSTITLNNLLEKLPDIFKLIII
jgi:hypothetical protein